MFSIKTRLVRLSRRLTVGRECPGRPLRRVVVALALIGALSSLVGYAPEASAQALPTALSNAFRANGLPTQDVGAIVMPLEGGKPLLALNADVPMNPASTMKILTTYAALTELGPDFRWTTGAYLRGPLQDGVLQGDLVLRGGGDPKFVIEDLTEFVARMRAAGLREIRGNLVLDDSIFRLDERSIEAIDGDPSQPYNVRPHGLLMNFKATKFVITPRGQTAEVRLDPPLANVDIDADIRIARGACRYGANGLLIRHMGTDQQPFIRISGPYSAGCGEQSVFAAVLTHRQFVHAFFKAAWQAAGGRFEGQTRLERGAARGNPWLEWRSPRTLADVVNDVNKFSNNVMARQLLLMSTARSTKTAPTIDEARNYLYRWVASLGLNFPELVVDNGSGLSREERISAANLARLLAHAAASPVAEQLKQSLPRVGFDGTMRSRLLGDAAAGNLWMKTGSLNDVRALAGYVDAASGKRYVLVMLVNGARATLSAPAQDALLRWVYANG